MGFHHIENWTVGGKSAHNALSFSYTSLFGTINIQILNVMDRDLEIDRDMEHESDTDYEVVIFYLELSEYVGNWRSVHPGIVASQI